MKAKLHFFALVAVIVFNAASLQAKDNDQRYAKVGRLVAMKHDGSKIYVSEHAVPNLLERGDSLALTRKYKGEVQALVTMKHNGKIIYVNASAVKMHLDRGDSLAFPLPGEFSLLTGL